MLCFIGSISHIERELWAECVGVQLGNWQFFSSSSPPLGPIQSEKSYSQSLSKKKAPKIQRPLKDLVEELVTIKCSRKIFFLCCRTPEQLILLSRTVGLRGVTGWWCSGRATSGLFPTWSHTSPIVTACSIWICFTCLLPSLGMSQAKCISLLSTSFLIQVLLGSPCLLQTNKPVLDGDETELPTDQTNEKAR